MFKNYLKIAFRNLWKNKGYSIVNILGLSIGLAVCLLIFLFIRYELSFDNFHKNEDRIYRVVSSWKYSTGMEYMRGVPFMLAPAMRNDFPELEKVAVVQKAGQSQVTVLNSDGQQEKKFDEGGSIFYVEPQFFEIFNFPWLVGKPETALKEPNAVALTKSVAQKFFGDWHKALGRTIKVHNKLLKVTGILKDVPQNTDFPLKIIISYATFPVNYYKDWSIVMSSTNCYVLLKKNATIKELSARIPTLVKKYYKNNSIKTGIVSFAFQPLHNIHFNQRYGTYSGNVVPYSELIALGIIAALILIIASINFINMATAQSVNRSKEVGIRKVLGSLRSKLMLQFIAETMLITLFAMFLACIITELTLPWMQNLLGQKITFDVIPYPAILLFMAAIVIITGLLAGFYPALIISGFNPIVALKNKINKNSSGGAGLRKILVVLQFTITLIIIIGTLVIMKQMNFFRNKPMGFDKSAVILVNLPLDSISQSHGKYETFKNQLSQIPGIENTSFCYTPPSSEMDDYNVFIYNNNKSTFQANMKYADTGYFSTFKLRFIAGHSFNQSDTIGNFVVNQTLLRKLNVPSPFNAIGKPFEVNGKKGRIVGVVHDFINLSFKEHIDPIVIMTNKKKYYKLALKLNPSNIAQTMKKVKAQYNKLFPEELYNASFYDKDIADYYSDETRLSKLFKTFAIIVLFISAIGLLSLLSFITAQRTKEIAIRKVLGASGRDILQLIGKGFMVIVIIANIIAWPVTYILAKEWLNGFAYRIEIPVWPFVITAVLSMVLTLLIIGVQIWGVLKANPMKVLKYE